MVSMRALQALTAVRDRGSVSAAAAVLGYTPSAVSQQIDRLQRETRTVLIEPYGRTVRLTIAGAQLAGAADAILDCWESAEAALERLRGAPGALVRVAAFPTAARGLLPQVLTALSREEPDLDVSIVEAPSHTTIQMVRDGDCDVAIAHDWPETPLELPPKVRARLLGKDVADVVLPVGHRHAQRTRIAISELAAEPWVAEPGSVAHDLLTHLLGNSVSERQMRFAVREFHTQLALIEAGVAIGLVPRMGRPELSDRVRAVPTEPVMERRVYAAVRSDSRSGLAVQAVLRALASQWSE